MNLYWMDGRTLEHTDLRGLDLKRPAFFPPYFSAAALQQHQLRMELRLTNVLVATLSIIGVVFGCDYQEKKSPCCDDGVAQDSDVYLFTYYAWAVGSYEGQRVLETK